MVAILRLSLLIILIMISNMPIVKFDNAPAYIFKIILLGLFFYLCDMAIEKYLKKQKQHDQS